MQRNTIIRHLEAVCDALENDTGATWTLIDDDPCYGIEVRSDEGEDVIITLIGNKLEVFADEAEDLAKNFDAEECAAKAFLAQRAENKAAPDSLYALLKNAEHIHGFYRALAAMLKVEAEKAKKARRV